MLNVILQYENEAPFKNILNKNERKYEIKHVTSSLFHP